ncbi:MAG TPA: hypothetical protein VHB21_22670 [Minicystis sp.]|nr:hypothetical protein [Minicystis sp.]
MKELFDGLCVLCVAAAAAGCGNPVLDQKISALGGEVPGVEHGEFHRPGQPCTYCHSDYYGAGDVFSVAGTIFAVPAAKPNSKPMPVNGAKVTITDTTGNPVTATTNCVGNFFFTQSHYDPQFPLNVVVEADLMGTHIRKVMGTRVNREGSCAGCHFGEQSTDTPGWIWVVDSPTDPFPPPDASCPGLPNFQ